MDRDLLSDNFTDNVKTGIIKRNIRLLLAVIILFSVFTLLNFIDWYRIISESTLRRNTVFSFYSYKIRPVIVVIEATLSFFQWDCYFKGNKLILSSFENDNPESFNRGYSLINKSTVLNIIGYVLIIVSISYRIFFNQ